MTKCNIKEDWLPAGQCEMLCGPDHHWNWWKLITKKTPTHLLPLQMSIQMEKYLLKKIYNNFIRKVRISDISTKNTAFLTSPSSQEHRAPFPFPVQGAWHQRFSSSHQLPFLRLSSRQVLLRGEGLPFSAQPPLIQQRLYLGLEAAEVIWTILVFVPACEAVVPH